MVLVVFEVVLGDFGWFWVVGWVWVVLGGLGVMQHIVVLQYVMQHVVLLFSGFNVLLLSDFECDFDCDFDMALSGLG